MSHQQLSPHRIISPFLLDPCHQHAGCFLPNTLDLPHVIGVSYPLQQNLKTPWSFSPSPIPLLLSLSNSLQPSFHHQHLLHLLLSRSPVARCNQNCQALSYLTSAAEVLGTLFILVSGTPWFPGTSPTSQAIPYAHLLVSPCCLISKSWSPKAQPLVLFSDLSACTPLMMSSHLHADNAHLN